MVNPMPGTGVKVTAGKDVDVGISFAMEGIALPHADKTRQVTISAITYLNMKFFIFLSYG
jgi:mannitol/fructose-specific phosphotransferase system IIA component (Ntr-type)